MSDLVRRLRDTADYDGSQFEGVCSEAAATIEILTENDAMKGDFIGQLGDDLVRMQARLDGMERALRAVDELWTCDALNFEEEMTIASPVGFAWNKVRAVLAESAALAQPNERVG